MRSEACKSHLVLGTLTGRVFFEESKKRCVLQLPAIGGEMKRTFERATPAVNRESKIVSTGGQRYKFASGRRSV